VSGKGRWRPLLRLLQPLLLLLVVLLLLLVLLLQNLSPLHAGKQLVHCLPHLVARLQLGAHTHEVLCYACVASSGRQVEGRGALLVDHFEAAAAPCITCQLLHQCQVALQPWNHSARWHKVVSRCPWVVQVKWAYR
jgi:hypothetical protein